MSKTQEKTTNISPIYNYSKKQKKSPSEQVERSFCLSDSKEELNPINLIYQTTRQSRTKKAPKYSPQNTQQKGETSQVQLSQSEKQISQNQVSQNRFNVNTSQCYNNASELINLNQAFQQNYFQNNNINQILMSESIKRRNQFYEQINYQKSLIMPFLYTLQNNQFLVGESLNFQNLLLQAIQNESLYIECLKTRCSEVLITNLLLQHANVQNQQVINQILTHQNNIIQLLQFRPYLTFHIHNKQSFNLFTIREQQNQQSQTEVSKISQVGLRQELQKQLIPRQQSNNQK